MKRVNVHPCAVLILMAKTLNLELIAMKEDKR